MAEGWIRSFDIERGTGLIAPGDGGPDLPVRRTDLRVPDQRGLAAGQWVSYTIATDAEGTAYAADVTPIAGRRRVSRTAVVLFFAGAALFLGSAVYTLGAMFGGWAMPGWWPYVFGGIIAVTLLVGRLVTK